MPRVPCSVRQRNLYVIGACLLALATGCFRKDPVSQSSHDLRYLAEALDEYAADRGHYPVANSIRELRDSLEPQYLDPVPLRDVWGFPYSVRTTHHSYLIWSNGRDGQQDDEWTYRDYDYEWTLDNDVVMRNGDFIQIRWGYLGGWAMGPRSVTVAPTSVERRMGMLILYPHRGGEVDWKGRFGKGRYFVFAPPTIALLKDEELIASNKYPPPVRFELPADEYTLQVTLNNGQYVRVPGIAVLPDRVVNLPVEVRYELLDVTVAGQRPSGVELALLQDDTELEVEYGTPGSFAALPGVYRVVLRRGPETLAEQEVVLDESKEIVLHVP